MIWYLFLMKGTLSVENNTDYDPDVHFMNSLKSPYNYALKYFFTVLFMTVIATIMYSAR